MKGSMHAMRSVPPVAEVALGAALDAGDRPGGLTGPTVGVERFWDRMTLSATPPEEPVPPHVAVPPELDPVLRLFEAAGVGSPTGGLSAPSAGALYPYEHHAVVDGTDGPAVYAIDAVRRSCQLVRTGAPVARALGENGLAAPRAGEALVLTVVRPWLSMRKYGNRGYLYAQIDAAHLAVHLLCLASDAYAHAELRTQLPDGGLADLLELGPQCRFLQHVLVLGPRRQDAPPVEHDSWTCLDGRSGTGTGKPAFWLEAECWKAVNRYRPNRDGSAPAQVRSRPLLPGPEPLPRSLVAPGDENLTGLAARRRSTKDFAPVPLSRAALARALAALHTPLATDLSYDTELGATLLVRHVTGCAPGSYRLYGTVVPQERTAGPDDDELVRVCMGQRHLRHAAAVVLFHVPRAELVRPGALELDNALLRSAALAHLLYLGAADARIAVTAIGGFDGDRWRLLAGLPDGNEVLYAVLLGAPGRAAVKLDRLHPAYAHNER